MRNTVVEADVIRDKKAILDLWERNFSIPVQDRYTWMYEQNPNGRPALWIAKTEAGDTIGAAGLALVKMKVGGRVVPVGQAIDLVVDKKYRTASTALSLQKAVLASLEQNKFSLLYAFPNQQSEQIFLRAGYCMLGVFERWTKPLRCDRVMQSVVKSTSVGKVGSMLINAAMRILSPEFRYGRTEGLQMAVQEEFDHRVDALWGKVSARHEVSGIRTSDYLNWRFGKALGAHKIFCLSDVTKTILGYVVCEITDNSVIIKDFLAADANQLEVLLTEFALFVRREGAVSISVTFMGSRETGERLRSQGFYKRPEEGKVLVYVGPGVNELDRKSITDRASWFLTDADRDV